MKKITFYLSLMLVALLSVVTNSNAQTMGPLWGMATNGGGANGNGYGTIVKYDTALHGDSLLTVLSGNDSLQNPQYSTPILASDGNYYGTTENGGGNGCIFKMTPAGVISVLAYFDGINTGLRPNSGLIQGVDGNLYGMTTQGGPNNDGAIYQCTLGGTLTAIVNFNGTNGSYPIGKLVQSSNGNLYGMTNSGGTGDGSGVIFQCTTSGTIKTLVNFSNSEYPVGGLILVNDSLYGMSNSGGSVGQGSIFKCDTLGNSYITLVNFTNNEYPQGDLLLGSDGNLYGMTASGGTNNEGNIFQCTTAGTITTLVNFANHENPSGDLIQTADGTLYGMTQGGGANSQGTVFSCTTTGTLSTLASFGGENARPEGSLLQGADGEFYGMTNGYNSYGTIFKCTTTGTVTNLYFMGSTSIANTPNGSLIQAYDGNLYGMAQYGGADGVGGIFKVTQAGVTTEIVSFNDTNGAEPYGSLLMAADSNLYGMTYEGGKYDDGTVFKYSIKTGMFDTLFSFNYSGNGGNPGGNLIQGKDGNLYGLTEDGGSGGSGTIFMCTTSGVVTVLWNFNDNEGPLGSLLQATDGNFYGLQGYGNSGASIFQYTQAGVYTELFYGLGSNASPEGSLIQAVDGNLYGMTEETGANNDGYIYSCTLGGTVTDVYDFTGGYDGGSPEGSLIQGTDSALYGMTYSYGANNAGTVFRCTTKGVFDTLYAFNDNNGYDPSHNDLLEAMNITTPIKVVGCTNQTVTAAVAGGGPGTYTYNWSTGATTSSITGITTASTYTVTVTNANGLALTQTVSVPNYVAINTNASESNPKCNGSLTGSATALPANGTPGYTYVWNSSPSQTTATATGLAAGNYMVTVTDINACNATASVTLIDPAVVSVATYSVINASCNGCTDGAAELIVTGGNKNTAVWSDSTAIGYVVLSGRTNDSINTVVAGTYVCTVTDSCGDSKTDTIRISQPILTGVQNVTDTKNVNIYPMPSNGHFTMALAGTGFQLLTIHDETGHEIFRQTLNDNSATVGIDLSMYADGIYFAQVITTHGVLNKKIVIQK